MIGIYKIENPIGGIYIGQSIDIKSRIRKHKAALSSYGCFDHIIKTVHELPPDVSQEVLDEYERIYIDRYRECGVNVFNLMSGGIKSYKHHPSSIGIFRKWHKGKHLSEEHRRNMGAAQKGRTHSDETKRKMSAWHKGKVFSQETRNKMSVSVGKTIYQYSKDGSFIKEWVSGTKASKELKIAKCNIYSCAKGNYKSAGGFVWKYSKPVPIP